MRWFRRVPRRILRSGSLIDGSPNVNTIGGLRTWTWAPAQPRAKVAVGRRDVVCGEPAIDNLNSATRAPALVRAVASLVESK